MKKLLPFLLLFSLPIIGFGFTNLQFDPATGTVQNPSTSPFPTTYPTTLAQYNINDPLIVLTSGSYANPTWVTSLAWAKLTGTPTTLAGYGITDPIVLTSGTYANPGWITTLAWAKLTGTPTTAVGYGITNGANIDSLGAGGNSAFYLTSTNQNAGTLPAARLPALTGDLTTTIGTVATVLATVNANVGSFGDATHTAQYTVNAKGLNTANASVLITPAFSSITGTPTTLAGYGITDGINTVVNDTNFTGTVLNHQLTLGFTGTIAAGRLNTSVVESVTNDTNVTGTIAAQALTLGWTGTLAAGRLNSNVVESVSNDTNITGSITGQALTFAWAGTLAAGRLNTTVVEAITNDTNITGSITAQNLSLGFTGQLSVARGGTGQATASAAYNALSPLTTLGDIPYGGASGAGTRLAGNITATRLFLAQTGNGSISAAPLWTALSTTDIPTLSLSTAVNGTLQAAQEPAHTADVTNTAGSLAMKVVALNNTNLAALATGILKNTTATGVPSIAAAGTDYLGITGGATITAVGALASGSLTTGFTAVAIAQGGTGQVTASSAFNALSPMTTAGDLILGGTGGAAARLAIGTNGQVLTSNGTTAVWGAAAGGGTVTINGVPSAGQLTTWFNGTSIQGVTALPAANVPAFTGDMTTNAGSLTTTVKGINGTLLSGLTTGLLKNTTATGVPTIAVAGTDYLSPFSGITANFVYASPNGTSGSPSFRALVAADVPIISATSQLSGTLPAAQFGALTGDVTNTSGTYATTIGAIGGHTVSLGGTFSLSGAFSFAGTLTGSTAVTFPTSGTLLTASNAVTSITGTASQITASGSVGAITLSLPATLATTDYTSTQNAVGITNAAAVEMLNTTAATNAVQQQYSPYLHLRGAAWNIGAAASNPIDWYIDTEPQANAGAATGNLVFSASNSGTGGHTKAIAAQLDDVGNFQAVNNITATNIVFGVNGFSSGAGGVGVVKTIQIGGGTITGSSNQFLASSTQQPGINTSFNAVFNSNPIWATGTTTGGTFMSFQAQTPTVTGTGTILNAYQFYAAQGPTTTAGHTVTNSYGFYQAGTDPDSFAGTLTLANTVSLITNGTSQLNGDVGILGAALPNVALFVTGVPGSAGGVTFAQANSPTLTASANLNALTDFQFNDTIAVSTFTNITYTGIHMLTPTKTGSGTIGTSYMFKIEQGPSATAGWGVYQAGSDPNLFTGPTTFSATVTLSGNSTQAGTATIGTANVTGVVNALQFALGASTGSLPLGTISYNSVNGMVLITKGGSSFDFYLGTGATGAPIMTTSADSPNIRFLGSIEIHPNGFTANGAVATAMTSLGPAGSHTTVQKWFTLSDGANTLYVPAF